MWEQLEAKPASVVAFTESAAVFVSACAAKDSKEESEERMSDDIDALHRFQSFRRCGAGELPGGLIAIGRGDAGPEISLYEIGAEAASAGGIQLADP